LLFTPPFDRTAHDPGYIKGYPPGVRENGGQYTHAAAWSVMAFAKLGQGGKAAALFSQLNPINHARTRAELRHYKVEPYVIAADIYSAPDHLGHGGWTWYTGSAGWMYQLLVESLLGLHRRGDRLRVEPLLPSDWPGFELRYRHGESTTYEIRCRRAGADETAAVRIDGVLSADGTIPLHDAGRAVAVEVVVKQDGDRSR